MPDQWDGLPFGRLMAIYAAVKNGRNPNPEDIKAIDDWRDSKLARKDLRVSKTDAHP